MFRELLQSTSDESIFQLWFAHFKKHLDDLFEIGIQFIQRRRLTVSTRKAGQIAPIHACVEASLDDRRGCFVRSSSLASCRGQVHEHLEKRPPSGRQ
jgi:hypothetical protein